MYARPSVNLPPKFIAYAATSAYIAESGTQAPMKTALAQGISYAG